MQEKETFICFLNSDRAEYSPAGEASSVEAQSWWWPIEVLCSLSTVWFLQRGLGFQVGGLADEMVPLAFVVQHFSAPQRRVA